MPDTDHDGISDADELAHGTNPNSQDTDGDGWTDNVDWYPTEADHDHDGVIDGVDHDVAPPPGHSFWDDAARVATAVATGGASEVAIAAAGAVDPGVQQQVINVVTAPAAAVVDVAEAAALGASGDALGAGNALLESVNDATFGGVDVNVAADGGVHADVGGHVGGSISVDASSSGVTVDAGIGINIDTDGDGDRDLMGVGTTIGVSYDDKTGEARVDGGVFEDVGTRNEAGTTMSVDVGVDGKAGGDVGFYAQTETDEHTVRDFAGTQVHATDVDGERQVDATLGADQTVDGQVTTAEHVGTTIGVSYDDVTGEARVDAGVVEDHTIAGNETRNEAGTTMSVDVGVDGKAGGDVGFYAQTETDEHTVRDFAGTQVHATDVDGERQVDATLGADQTVDGQGDHRGARRHDHRRQLRRRDRRGAGRRWRRRRSHDRRQ